MARKAILQESSNEVFSFKGQMKELTGGDSPFPDDIIGEINHQRESNAIYARSLRHDSSDELPQFRMILTCNKVPSIPSDDGPMFYFFDREEIELTGELDKVD